ncbi:MAG: HAD-IC family P-type ATPase [Candidatus Pacebacteria bacterium]|nr:HAD-IC family P-type ATPase [Candidatus Paceibacterota bacterium]
MSNFHHLKEASVFRELKTSIKGLKNSEIKIRQQKYGFNKLEEEKPLGSLTIFFSQFKSPLIFILLIAGSISLALGEKVDAYVIFGAVFINTVIGFFQENKANKALSHLKKMVHHNALVIRDGHEKEVESSELVPGDIILLAPGSRIPADARIIEALDLRINEANLTGESVPASKNNKAVEVGVPLADRLNMAYASTIVLSGSGKAVVTAIGSNTEIGKISSLVKSTKEEKTPLQNRLSQLSKLLGILVLFICLAIIGIGLWQGRDFFEMFIVAVAVAVSAIPEGLVVAVTVILVLGMQQILKKQALTRRLVAAETLGSTTVICTDKTGTLTKGEMQVVKIIISDKEKEVDSSKRLEEKDQEIRFALQIGLLCNNAVIENPEASLEEWRVIGLPTEAALLSASMQSGLNREELENIYPRVAELPFSSEKKFMATLHQRHKGFRLFEKGAPERVLEKSSFYHHQGKTVILSEAKRKELSSLYENLTKQGLRVIGLAYRKIKTSELGVQDYKQLNWDELDKNLVFVGFMALKDPLRKEAKETIAICREAGIKPIIITGDHKLTAKAIAKEIGFKVTAQSIMTGEELDLIDDKKLEKVVSRVNVFARVSPHHKLRIVKALQARGEVVAMTGDGINDSPALKAADIGVCLGSGTDIAKETADIVLLDNNFKVIVAAVKQGRVIFSNIRKVITYLISDSFSEVILVVGSILLGAPLAILPAQILWVNIVNDGLPNFSLAFEKEEKGIMKRKPISRKEPIINAEMKTIIFAAGLIRDLFYFGIFLYFLRLDLDINYIRTFIFAIVGFDSLLYVFSLRSLTQPIWKINPFSNRYLIFATIISLLLLLAAIYFTPLQNALSTVALPAKDWLVIIGVSILSISLVEISKYHFIVKKNKA